MKKLLAIAVAAAVAAPAAFADGPKVYGIAKISIGDVENVDGTTFADSGSRIGVKGMADLDNGLKATYLYEANLHIVDDNNPLIGSSRHAWAGLKGGFGEVRVGRQYTPVKVVTGKVEMFGDQYGDYNSGGANGVFPTGIANGGEITADDSIAYINKFGPVGLAVAYADVGGEAATTAMVNYSSNGIYAGVGVLDGGDTGIVDSTRAALAYKFPAGHKVGIAMEDSDGHDDDTAVVVSGGYKMGKTMLKAQYGERGDAAELMALGADYSLGKKTKLYIEHAAREANNVSADATAVGMVHKF